MADKSSVDAIVVSVPYVRPVYEKLGFVCVKNIEIDFSNPEMSEKWKEWEAEDMRAFLMIRPGKQIPYSSKNATRFI